MSPVPRYPLSVHGPAEQTESGTYLSQEAMRADGSKACRGTVEVRPFRTEEPVRALPGP
jgi:hypothetical protein